MDRPSFLKRSSSPLWNLFSSDKGSLLPGSESADNKPRVQLRSLLSHSYLRRAILWGVASLLLLYLVLRPIETSVRKERHLARIIFEQAENGNGADADNATRNNVGGHIADSNNVGGSNAGDMFAFVIDPGATKDDSSFWREGMPRWLKFKHLDGFYLGLKALVPIGEYRPEHPRPEGEEYPFPVMVTYTGLPTPTPFIPQPDYDSADYTDQYHHVEPCHLDDDGKVPVPDLYAYNGLVQTQPEPVIGSHKLLGLRDDVCFDRFGRYGPYGLGYSVEDGGVEVGLDTERAGSEVVWAKTGKINYTNIDWGDAQARCYKANKKRFLEPDSQGDPLEMMNQGGPSKKNTEQAFRETNRQKIPRTAVMVRAYTGFQWSYHAILNIRAMISELALRSGGEYAVHFLLHVRDNHEAIWADQETVQRILDDNVPAEFHSLCTLWSEEQMRLVYPTLFGQSFTNPSGQAIHGVYRSAHMPLQYFAMNHPEYTHFWNWELDMRWIGNYYELFDRLAEWGKQQSRVEAWERSAKYYIPRYHGDWDNFTELVHNETQASGRPAVFGPVSFPGRTFLRSELRGESFLPPSCSTGSDMSKCGVGEDADLITLNPIFDTDQSGWIFASDVTGYDTRLPIPPRRCAIVTASRLSRRLLAVMHEENWRLHHNMFSEMYPATMALHHGLKAVYAPHPVHLDREWDLAAVDKAFNGGRDHSSSGKGSPFDLNNEHNHKGTSWYYHSEFAGLLWRRWLGYAQYDGRGPNGGRSGEGTLRGGKQEEESLDSTGRLCLRSMLVHPIKWEHPDEVS